MVLATPVPSVASAWWIISLLLETSPWASTGGCNIPFFHNSSRLDKGNEGKAQFGLYKFLELMDWNLRTWCTTFKYPDFGIIKIIIMAKIKVQDTEISVVSFKEQDYICLTDMANAKESESRASDRQQCRRKENAGGARHHSRESPSCWGCEEGGTEIGEWTKKSVRKEKLKTWLISFPSFPEQDS